jgi:polyhydroxybutyrate depolymerase
MRFGRSLVVALAIAILAACSSTTKTATPTTTTAPENARTTTAAQRSCRPAPAYPSGTSTHHITAAGVPREFLVHMPPHPTTNMRLVVSLHGAGSNMQQQEIYSGFDALADKDGFVAAYPNGVDAAIRQWNFLKPADVEFAKQVVSALVRDACVDPAHAYANGISSGGAMTAGLACRASDTFAGFGPVAGDFYIPAICANARQRPIIIFHGTADPVVPYNGGRVGTARGLPVAAEETTAALWARHNGCTAGPTRTRLGSEVVRLTWNNCVAPVVLYRIEGGGHTWPGAAIDLPRLGPTTKQISATAEMWKFFAAN